MDDHGVVTFGAAYSRGGAGRTYQAAGCPLLRQWRLLCRLHASSVVAGQVNGKSYTRALLARRHDLVRRIGITPWRGTTGFGISDDEEYHESCSLVSPYDRRSVNDSKRPFSIGYRLTGALLIFFARTGPADESNGVWPLSGEFYAEVTYVGEGDVERGGKHVNDFDEIYSDIQLVLTPRMKLGVLDLGRNGNGSHLAFQRALPCPIHCSPSARLSESIRSCRIPSHQSSNFSLVCTNSGLGHLFWDYFNMPFVIGGIRTLQDFSPTCSLSLA